MRRSFPLRATRPNTVSEQLALPHPRQSHRVAASLSWAPAGDGLRYTRHPNPTRNPRGHWPATPVAARIPDPPRADAPLPLPRHPHPLSWNFAQLRKMSFRPAVPNLPPYANEPNLIGDPPSPSSYSGKPGTHGGAWASAATPFQLATPNRHPALSSSFAGLGEIRYPRWGKRARGYPTNLPNSTPNQTAGQTPARGRTGETRYPWSDAGRARATTLQIHTTHHLTILEQVRSSINIESCIATRS